MKGFGKATLCLVVVTLGFALVGVAVPAAASIAQPRIVSANPADRTPNVDNGAVYVFAQVGNTMYAGGSFSSVQGIPRSNIVAFDATTYAVRSFSPAINGAVWALVPSPDGRFLYIGGTFTSVNGVARRGLVKYNLQLNRVDPTFQASLNNSVTDAQLVRGRLVVAGRFTKRLVALDLVTGADTGYLKVAISGRVAANTGTNVYRFAVNPARTRLVMIGNFTTVGGQASRQAAMLQLRKRTTRVSSWHAPRLDFPCSSRTPAFLRDVDFSPDGSYFVLVSTGAPRGTTGFCDAAGRWETANESMAAEPTWINWTGGDTLHSVAVTGATVYVGGHQRWLDHPYGYDFAGEGSVSRPGIGSIDPVTGKATAWNPTRTRGVGAKALYATPAGLWVGSDTTKFGGEYHARIAFCPL